MMVSTIASTLQTPRVDHHRAHHASEDSGFDLEGARRRRCPVQRRFAGLISIAARWMRRSSRQRLRFSPLAALTFAVLMRHQAKEEAVLAEEGDDGVDHPAEFIFGILLAIGLALELLVEPPDAFKDYRKVQLFLVGKVRVDRPLADAGLVGNVVHEHFVEALGREEAGRLFENELSAVYFGHG